MFLMFVKVLSEEGEACPNQSLLLRNQIPFCFNVVLLKLTSLSYFHKKSFETKCAHLTLDYLLSHSLRLSCPLPLPLLISFPNEIHTHWNKQQYFRPFVIERKERDRQTQRIWDNNDKRTWDIVQLKVAKKKNGENMRYSIHSVVDAPSSITPAWHSGCPV